MEINKPASIIVTLVIALTIFFLFALPKYQESVDLELDLEKKQYQHEGRVDYYLRLSDILEDIEKNQDALRKVESALPPNLDFSEIIYFLHEKTKEAKLNLKSISFSKPESSRQFLSDDSDKEIQTVAFRVELSGSYDGFKKLLSSLEKSSRLFEVNSIAFTTQQAIDINKAKNTSRSYDFTLEIQVHTY